MMKKCYGCKVEKPLDEYYYHKTGIMSRASRCKACLKKYNQDRYVENFDGCKDRLVSQRRAWIIDNREKWNAISLKNSKKESGRFSSYKSKAKSRGISFSLTREQFHSFWGEPCHYCGVGIDSIGLDRTENSIGYHVGNIVSCCFPCNDVKGNMFTYSEMKSILGPAMRAVRQGRGGEFYTDPSKSGFIKSSSTVSRVDNE